MTWFRTIGVPAAAALIGAAALGACGDDDDSGSGGAGGTAGSSDGSGGASGSGGSGGGAGGSGGATGGSGGATGGAGGTAGATGGAAGAAGSGGGAGAAGASGSAGAGGGNAFDCSAPSGSFPALKLTPIAQSLDRPLIALSPPGDTTRLIIGIQDGVLRVHKGGALVTTPFMDISDRITTGGNEQGMLGLAFHPNYAQNGRFYVHYSADGTTAPTGDTVISEFTVTSNPDVANPDSEKVLLTVDQPQSNHNGGAIAFRGGFLYIGLGDGGSSGDQGTGHAPGGNGQSLGTMLGKILRIDVDSSGGGKAYGIPPGNMAGGALPEIWSYGFRNPYRWSFDACTNDMYVGDVGQNAVEEIDIELASSASGKNYGWRVMEGSACFNPSTNCDKSGKVLPIAEYSHGQGCSVTGGYVYRGSAIPGLRGTYLYADYCSGRFWKLRWNGSAAVDAAEITNDINPGSSLGQISSFGQDAKGELYVTSFEGGVVMRIDPE